MYSAISFHLKCTPRRETVLCLVHKPVGGLIPTMASSSILDRVFDDKRVAITVLMVWLVIVLVSFNTIGLFHSDFMRFGPHPTTKIMTLTIDSWHNWWLVAMASFLSTCVNDFFSD